MGARPTKDNNSTKHLLQKDDVFIFMLRCGLDTQTLNSGSIHVKTQAKAIRFWEYRCFRFSQGTLWNSVIWPQTKMFLTFWQWISFWNKTQRKLSDISVMQLTRQADAIFCVETYKGPLSYGSDRNDNIMIKSAEWSKQFVSGKCGIECTERKIGMKLLSIVQACSFYCPRWQTQRCKFNSCRKTWMRQG